MGRYQPKKKPVKRGSQDAKPIITGAARPKYVIEGWNVFDAALARMRWLFDEFDNKVSVSNSGGKDSTVVLELAAMVAKERDALPLTVVWLDQECEFQATVDYQRYIMNERDDIDFQWYQVPFRLYNATNHDYPWLNVWGEGEEWVRPKEPNSIHELGFEPVRGLKPDRFKDLLGLINMKTGGAILSGMRCEESPARRLTMTSAPMYKWVTWNSEGWFHPDDPSTPAYQMFHPIYDWSYRDVWRAIYENGWRYNTHYDVQFQHGVKVKNMRVSNYHHETAMGALNYLQEAEPETWEAATRRLQGISTHGHTGIGYTNSLPYMFRDWDEYLDHLIANLVNHDEHREMFRKMHARMLKAIPEMPRSVAAQKMCNAVIGNDLYGTTIDMFMVTARGNKNLRASWAKRKAKEEAA